MSSLIKKSQNLQKSAEEIVRKTDIVKMLSTLGKVDFVGSYALKLLYRPDIDVFVTSQNCSKTRAIKLTKEFLDKDIFQTIGFANGHDFKLPNNLDGYYWELIYIVDGIKWKFDVWYTAVTDIKSIRNTKVVQAKLKENPSATQKILELKHKLYNGVTYREGMNGFKIYEKILGKI